MRSVLRRARSIYRRALPPRLFRDRAPSLLLDEQPPLLDEKPIKVPLTKMQHLLKDLSHCAKVSDHERAIQIFENHKHETLERAMYNRLLAILSTRTIDFQRVQQHMNNSGVKPDEVSCTVACCGSPQWFENARSITPRSRRVACLQCTPLTWPWPLLLLRFV